jgi:nucleoside-diphosphate-sugar epimerase
VYPRIEDVRWNYSDTTKALNMLGWQAKTSLKQGLKNTIDWFAST